VPGEVVAPDFDGIVRDGEELAKLHSQIVLTSSYNKRGKKSN